MIKSIYSLICLLLLSSCNSEKRSETVAYNLRTEHLANPLGIDAVNPRFTWQFKDVDTLANQKSFQVFVGTDSTEIADGTGNLWHKELQGDSVLISYAGKALKPFTKYFWGIQVQGDNGSKNEIAVSSFETGMMGTANWQGSWITDVEDVDLKPAPYFRREIQPKKKVTSARAYIVAAGLYELYLNGKKVGNHRLDPVYTRFDKRNLYVTYDVTAEFQKDTVAVGVLLGNGWYNHQSSAVWNFDMADWRARPRFCLNIRLTYDDGSIKVIATDDTWKTFLSPVVFNSIYTAEHYDALKEQPGWDTVGFDDSNWAPVLEVASPSKNIVAQAMPPIRNVEEIYPVNLRKIGPKRYIFDLGRNISGVSQLKLKGEKGTKLWVTHAEQLDSVGNLDLSNIDVHYRPTDTLDPFQTDIYTLNGNGDENFMPKFNYKGFQYVEIKSDKPIELAKNSLVGQFMHTDVEPAGSIHTSNPIINKIWEATNASYLSNLFGYPTDCPQREKNGWTGDAHINIETGLYNFDAITVYEKWMGDHKDEQQPNGVLPSIIPTWGGWGYDWGNGPDWTSTVAIIPWELYQFYGDDHALGQMYEPIKKYVDHITSISHDNGLTDWGLGDWVPVKSQSPKELTSSIYYFLDATILAKAAKHFGNEADFKTYSMLAESIKNAINKKYLNTETGIYADGFQTEMSMPLYWGVVPEKLKGKVARNLANRVIEDQKHLDVGLLGTRTILGALSQNGYADLAYEVASQETYPSWGWWIKNGATTLYENWDISAASDISKNHIMFGAIGGWLYSGIGGILTDERKPGFKNVILKPLFAKGLNSFEASHQGPFGEIISKWERVGEQVNYIVHIPSNSSGTLYLKGKEVVFEGKQLRKNEFDELQLGSGTHRFKIVE